MGTRPYFVDIDLNQNEMQFAVLHALGTPPSSGSEVEGQLYYDTGSQTPFFWNGASWTSMSSATASSVPFSGITTQTNTSATMTVGTGAAITFSGSGTVNANQLDGLDVDAASATDGQVLVYQGGSIDAWQAVDSSSLGADLSQAVILNPGTNTRNVIQAVSGFTGLTVRSGLTGGGTQDIFVVETDGGTPLFRIFNDFGDYDVTFGGAIGELNFENSIRMRADSKITLYNATNNAGVTLGVNTSVLGFYSLNFPVSAGNPGDFLRTTDGSNTEWASPLLENLGDVDLSDLDDGYVLQWFGGSIDAWLAVPTSAIAADLSEAVILEPTGSARNVIEAQASTTTPLTVRGHASQSVSIFTVEANGGTDYFWVDSSGDTFASGSIRGGGSAGTNDSVAFILDNDGLGGGPRTFTFPNASGKLVITNDLNPSAGEVLVATGSGSGNGTFRDLVASDVSNFAEVVDDQVANNLIQDGTGISWVYDDSGGTLTPTVSIAGFVIDNLFDVVITTPADNEVLTYNLATSQWINQTAAEANLALATHTHTLADITDSGALAALNTVGTSEIDNNAVTFDKLEDVAQDTILGRVTAGAGNAEELTATQVRTLLNVEDGATADQTDEEIQDAAWSAVSSGTQTLITVTYQDGTNDVDFVVENDLSLYDNSTSGFITDITGGNLADISDVVITSVADNEVLAYNTGTGQWINQTAVEAGLLQRGGGTNTQVAYFSAGGEVVGNGSFTFDGTDVRISNELRLTSTDGMTIGMDKTPETNSLLNLVGDAVSPRLLMFEHYYAGSNSSNEFVFRRGRGTEATPAACAINDELGSISFQGWLNVSQVEEAARIQATAGENFSGASIGTNLEFWTAPFSTPTGASLRMTLNTNGLASLVPFRAPNGSVISAGFGFNTENNTGMYWAGSGLLGFTSGGTSVAIFNGNTTTAEFQGDVSIAGDLLVSGSTTTINTTNLIVEDNFIIVNSMGVVQDAGIEVERGNTGSGDNAFLRYSENVNEWFVDNGSVSHLMARKYAEEITGDGGSTTFDIDHNMGTLYVMVQIFDSSTGKQVEVDVDVINTTRVTLEFNVAPSGLDSYRVIVVG